MAESGEGQVDPATLAVLRSALEGACEEMNETLVRTAYSPNVTERRDCSCALFDAAGDLVAQAENMPVHLGAMPFSVAAALERFPPETLVPGDAVLANDPYAGGAHLPDLTLVTPVFVGGDRGPAGPGDHHGEPVDDPCGEADGDLLGFVANRAHHADVGGAHAGSVAADSTEIYQEGLRIPPVKLRAGGERVDAVADILFANVRTPGERRGDLRAQEAANATGRRRLAELVDDRGADEVRSAFAALQDYAERRMRGALSDVPDGTYRFEDALDDDGRGAADLPVVATVEVVGDAVTVDFAGTAPQTAGPVNAVFAVTASATYYAVRCVTDPEVPPNAGCYRPIEISTPPGSLVDPEPPAAVVGGNLETSQRVTDVVLGALAQAVPERAAAAGQGTMNNVTFGGRDPRERAGGDGRTGGDGRADRDGRAAGDDPDGPDRDGSDAGAPSGAGEPYTFYETQAGGFGGRAGADGMDAVHVHMSNTLNTPVEVLETAYPLRVRRYELRPDTGGAGEFRGGLGLRRDVAVRAPTTFSLLADRHRSAPYGLLGGEPGVRGEAWLLPEGKAGGERDREAGEPERLPPKTTRELSAGDAVSVRTPGGGGYGDPADRDPAAVRRDVRLGKLSPERARERYGVERPGEEAARSDE